MASTRRVAVVTGSNKGIGFGIVRGLCKTFNGDVYLTARNEGLGRKAVEDLKKEGLNPLFHQLDISDSTSIQNLKAFLQKQYGGLDVLVNNAGIAYKGDSTAPFAEQAEMTLKVNFWDTLAVCEALYPLLRSHARVVNVSSVTSTMAFGRCSDSLKTKIKNPNITITQLKDLMREFEAVAKSDTVEQNGWPKWAYAVATIGIRVMSYIQGKAFAHDSSRPDIVVNSCCPGYVSTDMSSHKGTKTIDEGAVTPLYLALLPPNVESPKGEFGDSTAPFAEQAEVTLKVNFWDTLAVCEALYSLLRPHARVVNVSSHSSAMAFGRCSGAIKAKISNPNISMDQLKGLMKEFEAVAKSDTVEQNGWPKWAYAVATIGIRVMSYIQGKAFAHDSSRPDIVVNSIHVKRCQRLSAFFTIFNIEKSMKTVAFLSNIDSKPTIYIDIGAVTPLYLALLSPNVESPKGEFLSEKVVRHWQN